MGIMNLASRAILLLLMVLYVPIMLGLGAGMIYGGYKLTAWFVTQPFRGVVSIIGCSVLFSLDLAILSAAALLVFGLVPLLFRVVGEPDAGIELDHNKHKTLFELIDRFAARLGTKAPTMVLLTPFGDTSIMDTRLANNQGVAEEERVLCIGAAHVVRLQADELMAVICHEIAHTAAGDTIAGQRISRFFESMTAAVRMQAVDAEDTTAVVVHHLVRYLLIGYYYVFALFYCAESRRREFRADRLSAEICGPQRTAQALKNVVLAHAIPDLSIQELFREYAQNERPIENLYAEHRRRWAELPAAKINRVETEIMNRRTSIWDTHPSLRNRIAAVGKVEAKELVVDKPAHRLFADWPKLEKEITEALVQWGRAYYAEYLRRLDLELRPSF